MIGWQFDFSIGLSILSIVCWIFLAGTIWQRFKQFEKLLNNGLITEVRGQREAILKLNVRCMERHKQLDRAVQLLEKEK